MSEPQMKKTRSEKLANDVAWKIKSTFDPHQAYYPFDEIEEILLWALLQSFENGAHMERSKCVDGENP